MVHELKQYKTADLVLQVSKNYNPTKLNLSGWESYLDILCENRPYQKEAIRNAVIFMASGLYNSIDDLVSENWLNPKMTELKTRYQSLEQYLSKLQLPGKHAANIDLATGTGKSFVMYGIAQIMMGLGLVDRVLVLCPSLTIEDSLLEKFRTLAEDRILLNAIPSDSKIKNPSIKTADVTIKNGDICIENIHAVYDKTGSSIRDSFGNSNERTLVLNDEAHHVYNSVEGREKEVQNLKKWKEFLLNPAYGFRYIIGFTGTAYIKDDYFNDVIYRYSLRQAIDEQAVKMVEYVIKNDDAEDEIKFQEIYDNHLLNKKTYRKVKPLTILITKDIKRAKNLSAEITEFLSKKEQLPEEECEKKVLVVTSSSEHKANVKRLKNVDSSEDSIEWIVSVSMLTEGWDVKNVFQIVPWEDRAFNSKLLIAQVLGRGLRIPPEYQNPQPRVRVFNHDAWSRNIKGLVDEILEIETRLYSSILSSGDRHKYHFDVHQISFDREPVEKIKQHQEFDYTKGYIELQSQIEEGTKETEYINLSGKTSHKDTFIRYETFTVDEIVNNIFLELKLREWEGTILKLPSGKYSKENLPPKEDIRKIIFKSMERVGITGNALIEKNKMKIESSFNTLLRKSGKTTVYQKKVTEPSIINTSAIERESIGVGSLRQHSTVFYSSDYVNEINNDNRQILDAVIEDESFPKSAAKEINVFNFKTPVDLAFCKYDPERKFIEQLCKPENNHLIDAWIKSRDVGFYSIEYSITSVAGKHSRTHSFNPDFFIKATKGKTTHYVVVETKFDNDISAENKAKLKYGKLHFEQLNQELNLRKQNIHYHFHFLGPADYMVFFTHMKNGQLFEGKFRSELEDKIETAEFEV